jgi:hypothetical protein
MDPYNCKKHALFCGADVGHGQSIGSSGKMADLTILRTLVCGVACPNQNTANRA